MTTETTIRNRTVRISEKLAIGYDSNGRAVTIASGLSALEVESCLESHLEGQSDRGRQDFVRHWYEAWLKERPKAPPQDAPRGGGGSSHHLPPNGLYSKGLSPCHRSRMVLVRSRAGGYVSRNCCECGKSYHVGVDALPELACDVCSVALTVTFLDGKNYFYVCGKCRRSWLLAALLPWWFEYVPFYGLATGPFM
jgi:hypothetical protein